MPILRSSGLVLSTQAAKPFPHLCLFAILPVDNLQLWRQYKRTNTATTTLYEKGIRKKCSGLKWNSTKSQEQQQLKSSEHHSMGQSTTAWAKSSHTTREKSSTSKAANGPSLRTPASSDSWKKNVNSQLRLY